MARGGPRKGAGRRKGQVSEPTKRRIEVAEKALAEGLNPLDYMLSILRDEGLDMKERFAAAKEAAPYVHPRLASVEVNADVKLSHEDALSELERATAEADANVIPN